MVSTERRVSLKEVNVSRCSGGDKHRFVKVKLLHSIEQAGLVIMHVTYSGGASWIILIVCGFTQTAQRNGRILPWKRLILIFNF